MDASEIDVLVQRLVANPHDQEALAYAHNAGNADPKSYAVFLEKVGNATSDPAYASHWLSEAANVWSITLGDVHRAARVLMMAVDKDPTQETAAERLAQLYRDKGEHKALVALLERRAKALGPLAGQNPDLKLHLAGIHEELGRLWSEPPLSSPKKGVENYKRAIELDATSAYAVYALRELYKQAEQWSDAVPLFALEQAIIADPERKLALYRDEADVRKLAGDREGATVILRQARAVAQEDPALIQELGASILDRIQGGDAVSPSERQEASDLFVSLAEMYDGEHGLLYSMAALDVTPGHDRAMQLAAHYARELERSGELTARWQEYLRSNPGGAMADEARREVGAPDTGSGARRPPSGPAPAMAGQGSVPPPPDAFPAPGTTEGSQAQFRTDQVMRSLQEASALVTKGQKPQALGKYKEVLSFDPANPEALAWVEDYLRTKRQYAELRDVLMQAVRAPTTTAETRKQQLLEVAGLCETQLRDLETAIQAWKQICSLDRGDTSAREHLRRLLERGGRWDELATVLEQEAIASSDVETKVALEKKLAQLHEIKRKDLVSAGEAWARIAAALTGDEAPIQTAIKLFEKAQRRDLSCQVIADNAGAIDDKVSRAALFIRLGDFQEKAGQLAEAGEAYVQAAEADGSTKSWDAAERCLTAAEKWDRAAFAIGQRAEITDDPKARAVLLVRASGMLIRAGDEVNALLYVEGASALDPNNDIYAAEIESKYTLAERFADLAEYHSSRAEKIDDKKKRASLRKRAAEIQAERLNDKEAARETLIKALEDGDDGEVLLKLADDAEGRGDAEQARDFLHRLVALASTPEDKVQVALREAKLLAESLDDAEGAIARYLFILDEVDPKNRGAVQKVAELEEKRDNQKGVAEALERELVIVSEGLAAVSPAAPAKQEDAPAAEDAQSDDAEGQEGQAGDAAGQDAAGQDAAGQDAAAGDQAAEDPAVEEAARALRGDMLEIARRLATLYEGPLGSPKGAIKALDVVHEIDPEDFEAMSRLEILCEKVEDWPRVADLLAALIEIEGDDEEMSSLTRKLADILSNKLDRGDDALAALSVSADNGDGPCREAYVELADRLGWRGIVATKLVEWHGESAPTPARNEALRGAFDRFVGVGREEEAAKVAMELARSKGADAALAEKLEEIATKLKDLEAMSVAHDLLARELTGAERAAELVRQAEVLVKAGVDPVEAQQHGETGLGSVPPPQVEQLLARLAALTEASGPVIDVYERQVGRCKVPADRLAALTRAAQVAAQRGAPDRAKSFYELALSAGVPEETLLALELSATQGDREQGGTVLRATLADALSGGGQGSRDGGRTRSLLLRRAAQIAHRDLGDVDKAFGWLGDALIAHVDGASLDALEELAGEVEDLKRAEEILGRALAEVFDGPLVRQLLSRRVKLRSEKLDDKAGAAEDLKKLHDLSPADVAVMDELSALLTELGDFRGMVHVLEDQILRGKDPQARAELARKVARLWEEQLQDAREAADAWRRVLRMKPGDTDAQAGLERAKADMNNKRKAEAASRTSEPDDEPPPAPAPLVKEKKEKTKGKAKKVDEADEESANAGPADGGEEPKTAEASSKAAEEEPASGDVEVPAAAGADGADGDAAVPVEAAEAVVPASPDDDEALAVDDSELVDDGELVDEGEFVDDDADVPQPKPRT
jgi:cellulose synthase operon protein C